MTILDQAKAIRAAMDNAATVLTDAQALGCDAIYRQWQDLLGQTVTAGCRFRWEGDLYRVRQPEHTFAAHYMPGTPGTESLFEVISEGHRGTAEDPIPYDGNMALEEGRYYTQEGTLYLCIRSTGQPVTHDLTELTALYVEVAA